MYNKIVGIIFLCGLVSGLYAADKELLEREKTRRLSKSVPVKEVGKRARVESCGAPTQKKNDNDNLLHSKSVPSIRTSKDEETNKGDSNFVSLEEEKCVQRISTNSSPQRSRFSTKLPASKKLFWISSEMLDDTLLLGIDQVRTEVKKIAQDNALKASNFYKIIKGMRSEFMLSNAQAVIFSNYFLYKVALMKSCKEYLHAKPSYIPVPNQDFAVCVQMIRSCLNMVTHNAITWPSVAREEDSNRFYKELLEKNKAINVGDIASPYYGAAIAINFLAQMKDRATNLRDQFRTVSNSEKLVKKHCKVIVEHFKEMACFVPSLNIDFDAEPLRDQETQE